MSVPGSVCSISFIFLSFFFLQFWFHWAGIQTFHLPIFLLLWWKHKDSFSPVILGRVITGSICFLFLPSQHTLAASLSPRGDLGESPPTTTARHRQGRSCGKIPPALPCSPCPAGLCVPLRGGSRLCKGLIFPCKHTFPAGLEELDVKRRCFGHVGSMGSSPKKTGN